MSSCSTRAKPSSDVPPPPAVWPRRLAFGLALGLWPFAADAQPAATGEEDPPARTTATAVAPAASPYGRRVVQVRIAAAWAADAPVSLRPGDILSPENLSQALNELRQWAEVRLRENPASPTAGDFAVVYVDATFDLPSPESPEAGVGVTLRPFALGLALQRLGDRILPIPRSPAVLQRGRLATTLHSAAPLVALTPDRAFGTAVVGSWATQFSRSARDPQIGATVAGTKSIDENFYRYAGGFQALRRRTAASLQEVRGSIDGSRARDPWGTDDRSRTEARAGAGFSVRLAPSVRLHLDGDFGSVRESIRSHAGATTPPASAQVFSERLVFEAIPPRLLGFFRGAVWLDQRDAGAAGSSGRLVFRAGYAKEIPVAPNQTIGVELLAGAGRAWGDRTEAQSFRAGNAPGQFLYDAINSLSARNLPDGPLLRSLGQAQGGWRDSSGGGRGGRTFWHLNLNLALPIPAWSRALIPDELTDLPGPDGEPMTLKQILNMQIDRTGPNMLQAALQQSDGLSPAQARDRAAAVFAEIRPATRFVINHANVVAVKPLLLFDVAGLDAPQASETWTAAGAGIQLTVVTAKLDLGYMRTLTGARDDHRGNLFGRLTFERLF